MNTLRLDLSNIYNVVTRAEVEALKPETEKSIEKLFSGKGPGNDYLGWLTLPEETTESFLTDIQNTAKIFRAECDYVVSIGIGGSYLGAKALLRHCRTVLKVTKVNMTALLCFLQVKTSAKII